MRLNNIHITDDPGNPTRSVNVDARPMSSPRGLPRTPIRGRGPRENKARKIRTFSFPKSPPRLNPNPRTSSGPSLNENRRRQREISSETNDTSAKNPSISLATSSVLRHGTSKSKSSTQSPINGPSPSVRATAQVKPSPPPSLSCGG